MRTNRFILAACLAAAAPALAGGNLEPDRVERWGDVAGMLFGEAALAPTESAVTLSAPPRAENSALVPVTIATDPAAQVTGLTIVVDDNPSPVAARVAFGPAGDPRVFGLRVRVEGYSNIHAVAATADGAMLENAVFVKGSGGCSAPIGVSDEEAMEGMGDMRLRFAGEGPEGAGRATLLIRHPNFNGMQMNQVTRLYTPSRFITEVEVTRGGERVFAMASDISLASNPAIEFLYKEGSVAPFTVAVADSEGERWVQDFAAPEVAN